MEKIFDATGSNIASARDFASEDVHLNFSVVTLRRPLLLFHQALGLSPGKASSPDPDFLIHVIEGSGHQQQLRKIAGRQFKNLENFLRGAHIPTETTRSLLQKALEVDSPTLDALAHRCKDGPLVPMYVALFEMLESTFVQSFRGLTLGKLHCPCCKSDILDDANTWWQKQNLCVPADTATFIDRLLKALLGGVLILEWIGQWDNSSALPIKDALKLATPNLHPMGHWMTMVRHNRGLQHDWELTVVADQESPGPALDGRLRKWRSGQDLLPMDRALLMIDSTRGKTKLKHALWIARTLSLAIDVLQASANTELRPKRKAAQEVISSRLQQLFQHLAIAQASPRLKLRRVESQYSADSALT